MTDAAPVTIYGDYTMPMLPDAASIEWKGGECIVRDAAGNMLVKRVQICDPRIDPGLERAADQAAERAGFKAMQR